MKKTSCIFSRVPRGGEASDSGGGEQREEKKADQGRQLRGGNPIGMLGLFGC